MMRLKTITILTLMLMPMISQAQPQQYQQVNDILYTASSDAYAQERCKLDVYYPVDQKDAPVVVWFHGGGIEGGNKHIDPQLKNSGLVVVAANYRLLPHAKIDDILDDAAAAVAWTYKNIEQYGGSHRKIFVAGHSAGGYLLDMIGLDKKWLAKYGVDADSLAALVPFSRTSVPFRPPSTSMPHSPTSVLMHRLSSSFQVTGNWSSMAVMRSRPTSGAC